MFVLPFSKLIIKNLIQQFDQNRARYMFLIFPIYQLLSFIGMAIIVFSFLPSSTNPYYLLLALPLAYLVGIPILASWHLSGFLFFEGFFGFFAWLGFPAMERMTKFAESIVAFYRPKHPNA
jgi:hypothetical protein